MYMYEVRIFLCQEGSLEKMMVEFEQEKQRRKTMQNGDKPENETTLGNTTL